VRVFVCQTIGPASAIAVRAGSVSRPVAILHQTVIQHTNSPRCCLNNAPRRRNCASSVSSHLCGSVSYLPEPKHPSLGAPVESTLARHRELLQSHNHSPLPPHALPGQLPPSQALGSPPSLMPLINSSNSKSQIRPKKQKVINLLGILENGVKAHPYLTPSLSSPSVSSRNLKLQP
jgi:hypothetical protein